MIKLLASLFSMAHFAMATFQNLDDYVSAPEKAFKWEVLEDLTRESKYGNTLYALNVTSLEWLDTDKATGINGNLWTHIVTVAVPKNLKYTNVTFAFVAYGENLTPNQMMDDQNTALIEIDTVAHYSQVVAVCIQQIPNTPIYFPDDPNQSIRYEDAIVAYGWNEYLKDPEKDPRWLLRLPMVKSVYQCMRAAQEALIQYEIAKPEGWVVSGISKRGWTTWDVAITKCDSCVNVIAIAPQVPVVPDLMYDTHHMWQTLGGFTYAFEDYLDVNFTQNMWRDEWQQASKIIDPINNLDRLEKMPKYMFIASNDQFMQFEWTNEYYNRLGGEMHLYIMPNTDHGMATAFTRKLSNLATFVHSIAAGKPSRPNFDYTYDKSTGELAVRLNEESAKTLKSVTLVYAETLTTLRRDFRWYFMANENTEPCVPPYSPIGADAHGELCHAPITFQGTQLSESDEPGVYKALPPQPKDGHWMGYYIQMEFYGDAPEAGDVSMPNHFTFTTPGYVWPDTYPFDDCVKEGCWGRYV